MMSTTKFLALLWETQILMAHDWSFSCVRCQLRKLALKSWLKNGVAGPPPSDVNPVYTDVSQAWGCLGNESKQEKGVKFSLGLLPSLYTTPDTHLCFQQFV